MSGPIKDSYVYEEGEKGYHADHVRDSHDWDYEKKFRSSEQQVYTSDDEAIREKVCVAIFRDRLVDPDEVKVHVQSGVVTLSGLVSDRKTKNYMEHYLEDIYGVVNIINELKIKPDHGLIGNLEWPV